MSYCRITGRAKALPKSHYFPLLPPISSNEARRFCRVTGKSYGLPSHHYIPVLLTSLSDKKKCKITNVSAELGPHHYIPDYGKRSHTILTDYRYIFPVFDDSKIDQKVLIDILNSKSLPDGGHFVYKIEEKKCNLVLPANLEAAVRDGDVHGVMLSKNTDTVLFKIKKGQSVSVDLQNYQQNGEILYEGEGPREDVINQSSKAKKRLKKSNKQMSIESSTDLPQITAADYLNYEIQTAHIEKLQKICANNELNDLMKPLIESWDWEKYGAEIKSVSAADVLVKRLPKPSVIDPILTHNKQVLVEECCLSNTIGFETVPCISKLNFCDKLLSEELLKAIGECQFIEIANHEEVDDVKKFLPTKEEIINVLQNFSRGVPTTMSDLPGLMVQLDNDRKVFLPGQLVKLLESEVFIPGEYRNNKFVAGLSIQSPDGVVLIPGHVIENKNFLAGQSVDGKFIPGQSIKIGNEIKFVEGQTVVTSEGLKFVAGIVDESSHEFVPGQFFKIRDNVEFIPGQTIINDESKKFIPGQNVVGQNGELNFVPGQIVGKEFVPGKSIITEDGCKFLPGQMVGGTFVPGITQMIDGLPRFIPGMEVETKMGTKFVEGQILSTDQGEIFYPGKTYIDENSRIKNFEISKSVDDVVFHEPKSIEFVMNPNTSEYCGASLSIFGHIVQTEDGVEFYPHKISVEDLPTGKTISGKLIKHDMETKFVPGIMTDDGFVPGQNVWTENGEQFVPGQVIETSEGLKFVPGQVIETKSGKKFVPGQTIQTSEGLRFVPGQIIQTKSGPTFIPGQIMCTEDEGERFVPGQVVDTEYGPRFVPGCVIETEDKVTFVPGQVVETADGLRFIAPDLVETDEGDKEFSMQSYLVSPEELKLLKPNNQIPVTNGNNEMIIDSKMMRQLSAAGMSIGQQVKASAIDFVLQSSKDKETIKSFIEATCGSAATSADEDCIAEIFSQIKNMIENISNNNVTDVQRHTKNQLTESVQRVIEILTATVLAVTAASQNDKSPKNNPLTQQQLLQKSLYATISRALEENVTDSKELLTIANLLKQTSNLKSVITDHVQMNVKHAIDDPISKIENVKKLCDIESSTSSGCYMTNEIEMVNTICDLLADDLEMLDAFQKLYDTTPKIIHKVVNVLGKFRESIIDEVAAVEMVKASINYAVKDAMEVESKGLLAVDNQRRREIIEQAIGFARVLELPKYICHVLNEALDDLDCDLESSEIVMELISRVNLMNKMAINDPVLRECMSKLRFIQYSSELKNSVVLRELVKQSGVLTIRPESPTSSTSNVPLSIMMSGNLIAMEDFFIHCGQQSKGAFLILKHGLQMVVPRELSHDVIMGKCAFTVLDDKGIRHFEPVHIFSLYKLRNRPLLYHRFSMYSCDILNNC